MQRNDFRPIYQCSKLYEMRSIYIKCYKWSIDGVSFEKPISPQMEQSNNRPYGETLHDIDEMLKKHELHR